MLLDYLTKTITDCGLRIMNYELLKYQDKNNAVQTARQRHRNAKTTVLFFDHELHE